MTRRHQIVHRADLVDVPGAERMAAPINPATVNEWAEAVWRFFGLVMANQAVQEIAPELKREHPPNA
jgi:hypothetical protein